MSPTAKRELRRYVQSRKQRMSFADLSDAVVAAVCILGFLILAGIA